MRLMYISLLNVILLFSLVDVLLAFRGGQQNSLELDLNLINRNLKLSLNLCGNP